MGLHHYLHVLGLSVQRLQSCHNKLYTGINVYIRNIVSIWYI